MEWIKVPYFDGFSQFAAWPKENCVSIDRVVVNFFINDVSFI